MQLKPFIALHCRKFSLAQHSTSCEARTSNTTNKFFIGWVLLRAFYGRVTYQGYKNKSAGEQKEFHKKGMYISDLYIITVILLTLGVVRLSLMRSGLSTSLAVVIGCAFAYSMFESYFSFFPILFCFLRAPLESFYLFVKTPFIRFFSTSQTGKKGVSEETNMAMDKHSEGETSNPLPPQKNIFGFPSSSSSSSTGKEQEKEEEERKTLTVDLPLPTQSEWSRFLESGNNLIAFMERYSCTFLIIRVFVPPTMDLFAKCRHTPQMQRYATYRAMGMALFILSLVQYSKDGGKGLGEAIDRRIESLFSDAELVEDSQELKLAREKLGAFFKRQVIDTNVVSDNFVRVSHEKISEFAFGILEDMNTAIEKDELEICLDDLYNLPAQKKAQFFQEIECISPTDRFHLEENCVPLYKTILLLNNMLVDREALENELLNFSQKKSLQPTEKVEIPFFSEKSRLGSLKIGDRTLEQFAQEKIDNGERIPISPSYGYDQFAIRPSDIQRHDIKIETEHTVETLKWMESLVFDHTYLRKILTQWKASDDLSGNPDKSKFFSNDLQRVEARLRDTQLDDNPLFPKQEKDSVGQASRDLKNQLDSPSGPPSPPEWHSPVEPQVEKRLYCVEQTQYWGNLGACTALLVFTSQIALAVLRRLEYTQKWIKSLTDRGVPGWMFFMIHSSNLEQYDEKSFFALMVSILVINLLILYFIFNMF